MVKQAENVVVKSALRVLRLDKDELGVDPSYQREVKAKHKKIVAEFDEEALGIPLIGQREDGGYWIVDGLQRITALRKLGRKELRAEVFRSEGPEHEARVFKLVNLNRTKLTSAEQFKAMLTSHDPLAWSIKNTIDGAGFKLSMEAGNKDVASTITSDGKWKHIASVNTLVAIAKTEHGLEALKMALPVIEKSWPGDMIATNGKIIHGLCVFLARHDCLIDEERLVNRLRSVTPHRLMYTAAQTVSTAGGANSGGMVYTMADMIEKVYNRRARHKAGA